MRWDGDTRGRGVGDAAAFVGGAGELVQAMREAEWVAEEPDAHLLPHLETSVRELPFELARTSVADDGGFDVELVWRGERAGEGEVRRAVFALIGSVAETATYVRQRRVGGAVLFEVVTGLIGDDTHFQPHGHAIRFRVAVE